MSDICYLGGGAISGPLLGGTAGSVLFVGTGSVLSQDNVGLFFDTTLDYLGIGTNAPNFALTVGNSGKGSAFSVYNTVDQTTNYERFVINWNTSITNIGNFFGGTGAVRVLRVGAAQAAGAVTLAGGTYFEVDSGGSGGAFFSFVRSSGILQPFMTMPFSFIASSGLQTGLQLNLALNQSGTAGYTALDINPTETATGSGAKLLLNLRVGGVSRFSVNNAGFVTLANQTTTPGAAAGTLTNCPTAGNPTGYVQIAINGSVGKIPYWV